jgi:hypothetical protein
MDLQEMMVLMELLVFLVNRVLQGPMVLQEQTVHLVQVVKVGSQVQMVVMVLQV